MWAKKREKVHAATTTLTWACAGWCDESIQLGTSTPAIEVSCCLTGVERHDTRNLQAARNEVALVKAILYELSGGFPNF